MNITVLTPSIGTPQLAEAVYSVSQQSHPVRHIVVADGRKYLAEVTKQAMRGWEGKQQTPKIYALPDNTGRNGYNGHKVYAYFAQLLDTEYLCLLDEDNTFDADHVASLYDVASKLGYAFSLRKVYDKQGQFICYDTFESNGKYNTDGYILVDTSSWMLSREYIKYLAHFDVPLIGDRPFTEVMYKITAGMNRKLTDACTGLYTLNYFADKHTLQFFKDRA